MFTERASINTEPGHAIHNDICEANVADKPLEVEKNEKLKVTDYDSWIARAQDEFFDDDFMRNEMIFDYPQTSARP